MVWLLSVGLEGGFDGLSVTSCSSRRLRTNASTAQPTGESTGVGGWSVANGPSPNDANTPCTTSRMVGDVLNSSGAAETLCGATRLICGGEIVTIACLSAGRPVTGAKLESGTAAAGALTMLCALTRIEAVGCDASLLLLDAFPNCTGELVFDDDDEGFGAAGVLLDSVGIGCASGCAVPVAGATGVRSAAEVIALDCVPPLPCASPLRGSSVAVDPIEVVPVMLVALAVDEVEVDPATEVPLDGAASDSAAPVDEEVVPVGAVVALDDGLPVEGVTPVDGVPVVDEPESVVDEPESVVDETESVGSAHATPGL